METEKVIEEIKIKLNGRNINILGQNYLIVFEDENKNEKLNENAGLTEVCAKKIVIKDFKNHPMNLDNFSDYVNTTLRHEIIHAFLYESGLCECSKWARNEEMVDFFAIQIGKMQKLMQSLDII